MKNIPDSVRRRLLNVAKAQNVEFSNILIRYAIERALYRLSNSEFADRFLLKGAMLLSVWSEKPYRPTLDVDLLSCTEVTAVSLRSTFRKILSLSCSEDGLQFRLDTITIEPIKAGDKYHGFRVDFSCEPAKAIIPVQIDIGFGDSVVPGPVQISYPTILEMPPPKLQAYPRETVIAEKFEALVKLGVANSRMKDFADLFYLAQTFAFDGQVISRAFKETFSRRETSLPTSIPVALTETYYLRNDRLKQWSSFLKRSKLSVDIFEFPAVCNLLQDFLLPPAEAVANSSNFTQLWNPGKGWH